jgi:anti-sigma factor RsiW
MTTCPTETAKLAYLNREMDDSAAAELEAHLESCPDCRA